MMAFYLLNTLSLTNQGDFMNQFLSALAVSALMIFSQDASACTFSSDCPTGYQCADHECKMGSWPNGGCTFDSDCQDGYQCADHECKMGSWPNGGCTFDSDCQDGYQCADHECKMGSWPNGGCTFDSDCVEGYECADHACVLKNGFISSQGYSEAFLRSLKPSPQQIQEQKLKQ